MVLQRDSEWSIGVWESPCRLSLCVHSTPHLGPEVHVFDLKSNSESRLLFVYLRFLFVYLRFSVVVPTVRT